MKRIQEVRRELTNQFFKRLRTAYYRFAFGRSVPFKGAVADLVHDWERRTGKGDVPKTREAWEAQYRTNEWAYMDRLDEFARYAVIIGYIAYLKPQAAVLDVGCGEGVLFERYRPYGYAKYVGLDISEAAVATLGSKQDAKTVFLQADAEAYETTELYDVIVFNESQYYFHDPISTLERYSRALKPGGFFVLSTYAASQRAMAILARLKTLYGTVDETVTKQGAKAWYCTVLKGHPEGSPAGSKDEPF